MSTLQEKRSLKVIYGVDADLELLEDRIAMWQKGYITRKPDTSPKRSCCEFLFADIEKVRIDTTHLAADGVLHFIVTLKNGETKSMAYTETYRGVAQEIRTIVRQVLAEREG